MNGHLHKCEVCNEYYRSYDTITNVITVIPNGAGENIRVKP